MYSYAPLDNSGSKLQDEEAQDEISVVNRSKGLPSGKVTTVHGQNRPFFHIDVAAAVESAIAGVNGKLAQTSSGSSHEHEVGQAEFTTKQD